MRIAGVGQHAYELSWFNDQAPGVLPVPWVLSLSVWWYKTAMLLWALWLAFALVRWLPIAWKALAVGGLWRGASPATAPPQAPRHKPPTADRKSTRLNSSHQIISYAVFCLKKKKQKSSQLRSQDASLDLPSPGQSQLLGRKTAAVLCSVRNTATWMAPARTAAGATKPTPYT